MRSFVKGALILGVAAGLGLATSAANASFVLHLVSGADDVIIVDDFDGPVGTATVLGASNTADGFAGDGSISFVGTVGVFTVTVTTAISKPLLGSTEVGELDLAVVAVSTAAGSLHVSVTDTDFGPLPGPPPSWALQELYGGTTAGTVEKWAGYDPDNVEFGGGVNDTVIHIDPFGPGAFSGLVTEGPVLDSDAYSLTQTVWITHTGAGQVTTLDENTSIVPEPATCVIWSLLVPFGIGLSRRRRRKEA